MRKSLQFRRAFTILLDTSVWCLPLTIAYDYNIIFVGVLCFQFEIDTQLL